MTRERRPTLDTFGPVLWPAEADEPILPRAIRSALTAWLTEVWAQDELGAVGLKPRKRALFDGPPGVGKTTLAHHLAARLGLPMVAIRSDRLASKWVSATGENIGDLFDLASAGVRADGAGTAIPVVIFLDEFDSLARQRRSSESGADDERNAIVNVLLQRIEQHDGFLIAATNFAGTVDPAIWRRFDIQITLELPGQFERERILARYLDPFGLPPRWLAALASVFDTASPALIRSFCEALKRQLVIGPKLGFDMGRDAVIGRIITDVGPHPTAGKPALWSRGPREPAIAGLPWPLPLATDIPPETTPPRNNAAAGTPPARGRSDQAGSPLT